MADRIFKVLFLCTGNSARSIMAEAILNELGSGQFRAFSAGSHPQGAVHPLALKELERLGLPTDGLASKSWDVFAAPDAPRMDFIFTVCDNAAGETCPQWQGRPVTAHWGIEDPAAVEGTDLQKEAAFARVAGYLRNRIAAFLSLPLRSLDALALERRMREIGQKRDKSNDD
jgi:arsenate reductase